MLKAAQNVTIAYRFFSYRTDDVAFVSANFFWREKNVRYGCQCLPLASEILCAPGTPEGFCCLSGGYESSVSILCRHRRGRLDIGQAASSGSGEYCSGSGRGIGELANNEPVMTAEGQVPLDEPASDTLEEFGHGFLTIFRLTDHALDGI
jgi:hypothetical protein